MWKFRENCPNSFVIGCVCVCVCVLTHARDDYDDDDDDDDNNNNNNSYDKCKGHFTTCLCRHRKEAEV